MPATTAEPILTEADIWARILEPLAEGLTPEAARQLLRISFPESDHARMAELGTKCTEGRLSPAERAEYDSYIHVGLILTLVHSKARASLKNANNGEHE